MPRSLVGTSHPLDRYKDDSFYSGIIRGTACVSYIVLHEKALLLCLCVSQRSGRV